MKSIKILGTGCPKCEKLKEIVRDAIQELGIESVIEKVTELSKIMDYGVMVTPALVIDEEVKITGKVPSMEEIKSMLL